MSLLQVQLCPSCGDVTDILELKRSKVISVHENKAGRTLIIRVQSEGKDQPKVHCFVILTDWETQQRLERRNSRTRQEHLRIFYVGNQLQRQKKIEGATNDLRNLLKPTTVLTLRQWTSLKQMPMTGGRGEIRYIKNIYSYLKSLDNSCLCYLLQPSLHGKDKSVQNHYFSLFENPCNDTSPCFFLSLTLYQSCALFFSLLPFFLSIAVYFHLWTPDLPASITSAGVKSAPTLLLAAVVLSWNRGQGILGVAGGLLFSAVGDCCLVWPELFLHGKSLVCTWLKHKLEHYQDST